MPACGATVHVVTVGTYQCLVRRLGHEHSSSIRVNIQKMDDFAVVACKIQQSCNAVHWMSLAARLYMFDNDTLISNDSKWFAAVGVISATTSLQVATASTLFVGGLPRSMSPSELATRVRQLVESRAGQLPLAEGLHELVHPLSVTDVAVPCDEHSRPDGRAFVEMCHAEDVGTASRLLSWLRLDGWLKGFTLVAASIEDWHLQRVAASAEPAAEAQSVRLEQRLLRSVPKPSKVCRVCAQGFASRNQLFRHLRACGHEWDALCAARDRKRWEEAPQTSACDKGAAVACNEAAEDEALAAVLRVLNEFLRCRCCLGQPTDGLHELDQVWHRSLDADTDLFDFFNDGFDSFVSLEVSSTVHHHPDLQREDWTPLGAILNSNFDLIGHSARDLARVLTTPLP